MATRDDIQGALDPTLANSRRAILPGGWYLREEEELRITSFGSVVGAILTIRTRTILPDGDVSMGADAHTPSSTRVSASSDISAAEGWLVGLEVFASAGTPRIGQIFVIVEVIRGLGSGAISEATLIQGYVTDTQRLSWPGSAVRSSIDGPGVVRSITGTNPAAGAEVSETVPTNARWRLHGVDVPLVTSAVVANRETVLTIDDGATVVAEIASGTLQAASLTRRLSFARNVQRGAGAAATIINAPIPDAWLQGGFRVRTVTTALDVGDDYGAPQLWVEEWIED